MIHAPRAIENYMSSVLVVIGPKDTLAEAARRMRLHSIRHLPVVDGKHVVGLLSQRDVYLVETFKGVEPSRVLVEEVMRKEPYVVEAEDAVTKVASEMAERRIGSAVVAHNGKLLGLFTTTDALRALATVLRSSEPVVPREI